MLKVVNDDGPSSAVTMQVDGRKTEGLRLFRYDVGQTFPLRLEAQIRALLSTEWPGYEDETNQPLTDAALSPVYFVLADGNQVLSYARTIRTTVTHRGQNFVFYGLGDVITQPESRQRGYGGRVVAEATAYIHSDREADAAVLLTTPKLEAFYNRSGWECVPGLCVTTSEADESSFPMMLFLSDKAHAARATFAEERLVLPGNEW
jgi:predicted N-acetyltransferase YhbS